MSKYQPPQLTEEEVEKLWQLACVEVYDISNLFANGSAYRRLSDHSVDIHQLATDHGKEIQFVPLLAGFGRIRPIDSPRIVTGMGD